MSGTVGIIGGAGHELEELVKAAGMRPVLVTGEQLASLAQRGAPLDVVLVDLRTDRRLLASIDGIKRRNPSTGIAIVAPSLDAELMLEAMRAGVTECITEPLSEASIKAAISRVTIQRPTAVVGQVYAIIGAKGGVGATTVAVNLAEALARTQGNALLIDLHAANGDASVLLGIEPKFSLIDAIENTHRLDEAYFRGLVVHTRSGLDLLASSPRMSTGYLDPQRVRMVIEFAVRYYRAVVLDVPRMDGALLDALDIASSIFVVVNHELPTVRSAFRLVTTLLPRYGGDRLSVLINRSDRQAEISQADIEKAVNARVKHVFPNDYKQALTAINKGEPFAQTAEGRLGSSFHALARELSGQQKGKPAAVEETSSGRLFGWLPRRTAE